MINIAKRIYLNTPSRSLRALYFRTFCALVRNRLVQASVDGINYKLDLGENIDLSVYLGRYEPDIVSAIERYCLPGFTVMDIGANIGAFTLRLAKIVGESGKVCAFEPTDYAYKKLIQNISLNQFTNIVSSQIALSDRNLLQQRIRFRSSWPTKGSPIVRENMVDFVTLDDWCKREDLKHVDLIKLDVDGNEYSVIMGGKSLLADQHPLIIMEVWGPNFSDHLKNPFIALRNLGYRFFHIDTEEEYASIDDLKAVVSRDGKLTEHSFNIIVRC